MPYQSVIRTFRAPAFFQDALNPPADLVFSVASAISPLFVTGRRTLNPQSNIYIRSAGIFSNFADGMVFKSPDEWIDLSIFAVGANSTLLYDGIAQSVDMTAGASTVSGVATAFDVDLIPGDFITIGGDYYRVDTITDPLTMDVIGVARKSVTFGSLEKLTISATPAELEIRDIRQLNYLLKVEKFINIASLVPLALALTDIVLYAGFSANCIPSCTFLTKTVDAAFVGNSAYMDAVIEIDMME